jgi:membrane-bound lytic murein transglycosylase D
MLSINSLLIKKGNQMRELSGYLLVFIFTAALACSSTEGRFDGSEGDVPEAHTLVKKTDCGEEQSPPAETQVVDDQELIDDEAIYKFSLAEEYYAFGVAANIEKDWKEAEYNFEKAIDILTTLEVAAEDDTSQVALEYRKLMNEITADYKITLFNLTVLSEDASPYALDEKFRLLDSLSGISADSMRTTAQATDKVTYDLPVVLNDRVKKWIYYYQTSARKNMEIALARSGMYMPIMEKILKEEGVPHDLVYLPIIESAFKDRAYSHAHAAGFWQFISSTARNWGLKRNWWYDERYDFEKSTRAAARYLKYLYKEFGDWRLALTAYNGGSGNVRKMIRRNPGKDYWDWKIWGRDMRNFVSKYMAATIIAKNPERYGFDVQKADPLIWDEVKVGRALYLKDIAKATGVSVRKIKELNPEIRRDYTPPDYKNYTLRLPKGTSSKFLLAMDDMQSPKETSWVRHRIRRGETVSTIARRYRVSQSAIVQANNLHRPYRIYAGHTLVIPVPLDRGSTGYASSNRNYELTGEHYIVRPGDNLWSIARAFKTTTEAIRRANNLPRKNLIYAGQRLRIPGYTTSSAGSNVEYFMHTIRKGETLSLLAKRYGCTISQLCALNRLSTRSTLHIGQRLKVPGKQMASSSRPASGESFSHTIRRGETLSYLARRYNTSVLDICRLNGISTRSTLHIGQKLKIPGKKTELNYASSSMSLASGDYFNHRVRYGQNLWYIARKYGTTIEEICRLNGISRNSVLAVGQALKVPIRKQSSASSRNFIYYTIKRGDTLWEIARSFATSTDEILSINNHINPRSLKPGEKIKIRVN